MNAKLIVLLLCIDSVVNHKTNYCVICRNHTLCKYTNPGPGENCLGYDKTALLTDEDVRQILNRINNKRNLIALHQFKYLPGATNMKKIEWSKELAVIAQRWADQCSPALLPDERDECRDTDKFEVGQNIASVFGSVHGVNVKSFIDIWFIESLDYVGDVSFFNQSQNYKTNYFTQLIWADTDQVGCGKVRFYMTKVKKILVERLVCNFAPKGNVHGKPIYIIGYPSTLCSPGMESDAEFKGLCSPKKFIKVQTESRQSHIRSFRLPSKQQRNLSPKDNPCTEEPTRLKRKKKEYDILQNSYAAQRSSVITDRIWTTPILPIDIEQYQQQRVHSHTHYDHEVKLVPDQQQRHDWRKYNKPSMPHLSNVDSRIYGVDTRCTRRDSLDEMQMVTKNKFNFNLNKCTRGMINTYPIPIYTYPGEVCPCNQKNKCSPYSKYCYPTTCYATILKMLDGFRNKKNSDYSPSEIYPWKIFTGGDNRIDIKEYPKRIKKEYAIAKSNTTTNLVPLDLLDKIDQNYRERHDREIKETELLKPFWKIDESVEGSALQLKALRYTTLTGKKNRHKTTKSPQIKTSKAIEAITLNRELSKYDNHFTEKYLSFDELLHLRKFNNSIYRRRDDESPSDGETAKKDMFNEDINIEKPIVRTVETNTSEYTLNTPFMRLKHCTRKLTCTWTATFPTDSAGNQRHPSGGGGNTPPGYVEGCTRTSTCTRDFMNRNKMATLTTESTLDPNVISGNQDEDDYCERRSLSKRDISKNVVVKKMYNRGIITDNISPEYANRSRNTVNYCNESSNPCSKSLILATGENNKPFLKARNSRNIKEINNKKDDLSYGDLYYFLVQRLTRHGTKKAFTNSKCVCNNNNKFKCPFIQLFLFVIIFYFYL